MNFLEQSEQASRVHAERLQRMQTMAQKYPSCVTLVHDALIVSPDAPEHVLRELERLILLPRC